MSKSLKFVTILFIIFMLFTPILVQATDINMNLTADTTVENTYSDNAPEAQTTTQEEPEFTSDTLTPSNTNYSTNSPTVSTLNQLPEASLGLSNVINIILIVIGVLLILLGIAIIIRLKH